MKAAVLFANEDIRYTEVPEPEIRPGCVKVRVRAVGICGSDIPRVLSGGAHYYPIILGHEFSGEVTEVGEGVTKVKVGDRVSGAPLLPCMKCADCRRGNYSLCRHYGFIGSHDAGTFAEYVVLPEANAVRFDPAIPFEVAAMFEPATVSLHGLFCNNYQGGGNVAVLGGGTIGLFAAQWAKIFGARSVTVFDIVEERLALAKRLGTDETIDTKDPDFMEKAKALTDGSGFDYVFETAGNPITIRMGFELAANKAHFCCIGTPHREMTFTPSLWECMNRKEFTLTGSWMSYSSPFPGKEWELVAHYFATGQLKFDEALIYRRFPLEKADEAFALYHDPAKVQGKVMFLL